MSGLTNSPPNTVGSPVTVYGGTPVTTRRAEILKKASTPSFSCNDTCDSDVTVPFRCVHC